MNDLVSINDLKTSEIKKIFELTKKFKKKPMSKKLKNKNIALLFAKPSTRTRVSFVVAINQLGGGDIFLPMKELQISRGETIEDTARVLSRYCDGVVARLFKHENMIKIANSFDGPAINGLTDLFHPCQGLTDLFTVQEKYGKLKGLKLAFVGDGNNNVTHSLMNACSKLGVDMNVACPNKFRPDKNVIKSFKGNLEITSDVSKAVKNVDVVYTDTWVSMGDESQSKKRERVFKKYQVNKKLMNLAKTAIVMHDLPAHRGFEITSEVMDGKQSVIFDQAENRLHVQKAILAMLF